MAFAGGDGTVGNPYQVSTVQHMLDINALGFRDKNYILINDLDFSTIPGVPTGLWQYGCIETTPFSGVFDGNNKTISKVNFVASTLGGASLFGFVSGEIKNLKLREISNTLSEKTGYRMGALCSELLSGASVNGCDIEATLIGDGATFIGGITGDINNSSTVSDCIVTLTITSSTRTGGEGGIAGICGGTIQDCVATVSINTSSGAVGGIAGYCSGGSEITRSYAKGSIVSTLPAAASSYKCDVGGLVGFMYAPQSPVAYPKVSITNCYSECSVVGAKVNLGTTNVGGLVGRTTAHELATEPPEIINCYSRGAVTSADNSGGLIGYRDVAAYQTPSTVTSSYYDTQTSGQSDNTGKGTPKTTAQMKTQATFVDWDFDTVWGIEEGVTYPNFEPSPIPPETVVLAERDLLVRYQNNGSGKWSDWRKANLGERGDTVLVRSIKRLGCYKTRKYQLVWFASVPIAISVLEERARLGGENGQS